MYFSHLSAKGVFFVPIVIYILLHALGSLQ